MIIYKAINKLNLKVYVGQTVSNMNDRIRSHKYASKNKKGYFNKALNKYGIENFIWEVIEECNTKAELDIGEKFWINRLKSNNRKFGYNLEGGGTLAKEISESTRLKVGNASKIRNAGKLNPMYGKTHSLDVRSVISKKQSNEHHYRWLDIDVEEMNIFYEKTNNIRMTAKEFSVSDRTVRKRLNIKSNNFRERKIIDINKLIKLHNEGMSFFKIGKEIGIHHTTVKERLIQEGIIK